MTKKTRLDAQSTEQRPENVSSPRGPQMLGSTGQKDIYQLSESLRVKQPDTCDVLKLLSSWGDG